MIVPAPSLLSGVALSGAALLAAAGAGKLLAAGRGHGAESAIQRALGVGPRAWRMLEVGAAPVECATAAAVLAGLAPVTAGAAMAAQGALFTLLLAHARRVGAPGGCGCLGLLHREEALTGRSFARALWVTAAGLVEAVAPWPGPGAAGWPGPVAGAVAGGVAAVLLTAGLSDRTPRCHRRLWFPVRETAGALVRHPAFAAMAAGAGPLGTAFGHRRNGCADELWFPAANAPLGTTRSVCFRVTHGADGALAVRASVQGGELPVPAVRRVPRTARPGRRPAVRPPRLLSVLPVAGARWKRYASTNGGG